MNFKLTFVLIFVFIQATSFHTMARIDEDEYMEMIKDYRASDRNDDAIACALRIIDQNPEHPYAHLYAGICYKDIQYYSEAIRYFKKQAELYPIINNYGNLGAIYGDLEYDSLAQEMLNKALMMDDDYGYAQNNLGALHIGFRRYDEGEPYIKRAIELMPDLWNSYLNMAIILNKRKEYDLARQNLEKCLALNPYCGNAQKLMSSITEKQTGKKGEGQSTSELRKAIALYSRNIKRNWYDAESTLNRARAYEDLGDKNLAEADYRAALIRYNEIVDDVPDSREMRKRRASLHVALKNYDLAMVDYNYILSLYPNDAMILEKIDEMEKLRANDK